MPLFSLLSVNSSISPIHIAYHIANKDIGRTGVVRDDSDREIQSCTGIEALIEEELFVWVQQLCCSIGTA